MGDFSIDPKQLAVLTLGSDNRGLHIIRPDAGFGYRNGFAHNPSIGGHPAFAVPDIQAVMRRLRDADVVFSDAGTYAMTGYHQVYLYDPSYNLIEINQKVA
jgi:catechol 2,3-dioxygenase-like lactoylglutathione lyase family enzyme